jgi:hypothetical protein
LPQTFLAQVIGGEIKDNQAGHGAQGSQQLSSTFITQPVSSQAQLPEHCVAFECP